jgi:general secretion pathway protein D
MNKQQRLKQLIAALALAGFFAPVHALAQDDVEARNQAATLATEAVTAKESGDLVTAKAKLEEVLKLNPSDAGAKELLTEVNKALLEKTAPAAPAKPLTALDRAAEGHLNLFREVDSAMIEAQSLASRGEFDAAVALLDQAASALPANTAGQAQKDRVTILRQQVIASRDSGKSGGVQRLAAERIAAEVAVSRDRVSDARRLIAQANSDISARHFDDATAALAKAESVLPTNSTADTARVELKKSRSRLHEARYTTAIDVRDMKTAEQAVADYETLNGKSDERSKALRASLVEKQGDPHYKAISDVSPGFAVREKKANELLAKGRAQYLYGDYLGALETYKDVLQYQPYNTEAKSFAIKIREILHEKSGRYNADVTKTKLLEAVDMNWATSEAFNKDVGTTGPIDPGIDPVITRMKGISIPSANLKDMRLDRVIETLGELSLSYDKDQKGVNFVLIDPDKKNPEVSLNLREMTLDRVLEQVLRSVNFSYSVNNGVVEIRADATNLDAETEFFPLSKQSLARMTGIGAATTTGAAAGPFGGGGGSAEGGSPEVDGLKRYFRSAGIDFSEETAKGTGIGYDGIQLIVTHNRRTLERIRNIVRRYSDVKQVAIETKFIEVTQGTLNEIAANWTMTNTKTINGQDVTQMQGATGNRTLDSAFRSSNAGGSGRITNPGTLPMDLVNTTTGQVIGSTPGVPALDVPIPASAPNIPGSANYGASNNVTAFNGFAGTPANGFVGTIGSSFGVGGYDVNLFIQALEQTTGSDLMAAPSLTVASGTTATIKIAQLLRYPESYSQIQSQVGSSNGNQNQNGGGGGGAGSVSITAGTPQDFVEKEVGVSLEVVPTVSEAGDSIDLDLKPKITEFEGFVEYGGTSVAVAGQTVVTVPSGFYQPIFSIREVATKVTVYDGATVVIGGLTREEVRTVHDKVPVLGDMPLIGKLFQSNGKTSSKKNLMIFVTANMISPTGSMLRTSVGGVRNGTTFQNPTVASPSGPLYRSPVEKSDK